MVNKRIGIWLIILSVVCAAALVIGNTDRPVIKASITKPDCIIPLVKHSAFVCELVRLQDQYYLRCALATKDTALFNPLAVLAINFPDTTTAIKWPVIDHRLQAKLGAMPDELFIVAVDSTQLLQILKRPDQMTLWVIGFPNNSIAIKVSYEFKQQILMLLGLGET